jgi:NADH:ubiquinone oxidoreductase subunit F (NADH-binding)
MILFPKGAPASRETFQEYLASGGYQPVTRDVLQEVTASGLRGRGGAGFPVARKWSIAAETPADTRYLVCNAGEDEPGSFKDRILLEHRPHLVLEGMILAARAIKAGEAILYLNETYDDCFERFSTAIAATVYVAGEDSAALEVLEGKTALPRQKPPYPATAGLFGKPTVVNNVESLANVQRALDSAKRRGMVPSVRNGRKSRHDDFFAG